MDREAFDRLARLFATASSRRTAFGAVLGIGMASVTGQTPARKRRKRDANARDRHVGAEAVCASPGPSSNLNGCNFNNEDLADIDLSASAMKDAKFRGADLCRADLSSSQLKNADFRGFADGQNSGRATILFGADLSSSGCSGTQFNARSLFCNTKTCGGSISNRDCPAGIDPEDVCCSDADCGANAICDGGACRACDLCASGCLYSSLSDAVNGATAGSTLYVCPGTYIATSVSLGKNLTIVGAGSGAGGTVLSGNNVVAGDAFVTVAPTRVVALRDLVITGGNHESSAGGGIRTPTNSVLTLTRVRVENNQARSGGGIFNNGTLTLEAGTVITANTATGPNGGGGIYNQGTLVAKPGSAITANNPNNCVDNGSGSGCP